MIKPIEEMSFEEAMTELEGIVRKLEEGRVQLEEAIQIFERGSLLKSHCQNKLNHAVLKIEQVNPKTGELSPSFLE